MGANTGNSGRLTSIWNKMKRGVQKVASKIGSGVQWLADKTRGIATKYGNSGLPAAGIVKRVHGVVDHAGQAASKFGAGDGKGAIQSAKNAYRAGVG
jgi:hypothetical protein